MSDVNTSVSGVPHGSDRGAEPAFEDGLSPMVDAPYVGPKPTPPGAAGAVPENGKPPLPLWGLRGGAGGV